MNDIADRLERETDAARAVLAAYHDLLADDDGLTDDMIEGQTSLTEAIRRAVVRIAEIDAMVEGLKGLADKIGKRAKRLAAQKENLRTILAVAVEVVGKKRLECDIATVSLIPGQPKSIITNEADIPAEFWKRADPEIRGKELLKALKEAYEEKREIPGAILGNGEPYIKIHPL